MDARILQAYRYHMGWTNADDAEVEGRLYTEAVRYDRWKVGLFKDKPAMFAAYEAGNAEAFATLLGVPWPLPAQVTVASLAAELAALNAKFQAFAGVAV